jgi:hypothetical protein
VNTSVEDSGPFDAVVPFPRLAADVVTLPVYAIPRQNESVLSIPPRNEQSAIAFANSRYLSHAGIELNGISLSALREQTQAAVIAEAAAYSKTIVGCDIEVGQTGPLIVTGHQPELFHAGVWAKNFAAAGLARKTRGLALNLIVDNDTVAGTRMRVPVGTRDAIAIESVAFDAAQPEQPWEEAAISDPARFCRFGELVQSKIRQCWNYEPLVSAGWLAAIRHSGVSPRLGDCLTAARVSVEWAHGIRNLEVPMSRVCSTPPFCLFAAHVLAHLPRFQTLYNQSVRGYRRAHRIRNRTHPVPELDAGDGWFEAPFWVWRKGDQRRDRPFARQTGAVVELRDSREIFARLPLSPDRSLAMAATNLGELGGQGIRFRTRALTTTLFARLFLADLFVHGIGGAKYDAMTDQICADFFGIKAPPFATVSATVHLPLGSAFPASADELRRVEHRIRDLKYNPDRSLSGSWDSHSRNLIDEKSRLVSGLGARRPTRLEHRRLVEINSALFSLLETVGGALRSDREQLQHQLRANSVLQDREFSWSLQPEEVVTSFFRREFLD